MATLPCDGKGNRAPHITPDPTRRAQQTVLKTSINVCYSGRLQVPSRTGSGAKRRRRGAAGGGQPAAGQEELPQRPPVKCGPSLLVGDALRTQENTRLRAAAQAWLTPGSAYAARNTGNKGEFPSEGTTWTETQSWKVKSCNASSYFSVATKYKPAT